jgi:hypothetical protein
MCQFAGAREFDHAVGTLAADGIHQHAGVDIRPYLLAKIAVRNLIDVVARAVVFVIDKQPCQLDIYLVPFLRRFCSLDTVEKFFLAVVIVHGRTNAFAQRVVIALASIFGHEIGEGFHLRAHGFNRFFRSELLE